MLIAATRISAAMRIITTITILATRPFNLLVATPNGGKHTYPLQILPVARPDLVLQHGQQIAQHVEPLHQQADALVHLEVAAHGAVDGRQLRLRPHQLGRVEHGALQVDVDAQDEELADLLVDGAPRQGDAAGGGEEGGERRRGGDGGGEEVFEEGGLWRWEWDLVECRCGEEEADKRYGGMNCWRNGGMQG